jgi:hypothetical protein
VTPPFKLLGNEKIPKIKPISLSIARNNNQCGFNPFKTSKKN